VTFAILVVSLWLAAPVRAADTAPATLTLEQAIDLALQQNTDVALADLTVREFRSQYKRALSFMIPDVRLKASYQRNILNPAFFIDPGTGPSQKVELGAENAYSVSVGAEQTVFAAGKVLSGVRLGERLVASGDDRAEAARREVTFGVKELFYSHLLARETESIQKENLDRVNDQMATIRERFRQGLDSDLTVLRQQVEVATAKTALIAARNLVDLSLTRFQHLLALDVDRPLTLDGTLAAPGGESPPYERLVRTALDRNPSLAAAVHDVAVREEAVRIARADHFPELVAFGDWTWSAQSDAFAPGPSERNQSVGAGLRLDYPFFTGGEVRERVALARIELERARKQEEELERAVRVELKSHWLNVAEARERAGAEEAAVTQARRALDATEARFKAGRASQLELNDATYSLGSARRLFAKACRDYWVAWAGLEAVVGMKLEEIQP
jgi:outer membrane protein TolC